jgi:UDP-N-acetylmuramoylalanine--D-glutamate ligase
MSPRPRLSWSDLRGARLAVWGLGVEGEATLRRLGALGIDAVLVDDSPGAPRPDGREVLATDAGGLEALLGVEVVIKAPGISRYRDDVAELERRGVAVAGGLGLWLEEVDRDRVVCVTGTKGKSTTTAIAGHLLASFGVSTVLGGNIGQPPWDPGVDADPDAWVIETSSFQATDVASSPPLVVVTSLSPDHLDWHGDAEHYVADKLSLCTRPGAVLTVANGDSAELRRHAALLGPEVRWVGLDQAGGWSTGLGLAGEHNRRNAELARHILEHFGVRANDEELASATAGFVPLESRLRTIGEVDGVRFVDDSLSTNVLPTLAALDTFANERVALLVGGHDRGIDYASLAEALAERTAETLVVAMPASGVRIAAEVRDRAPAHVAVIETLGLDDAVDRAFSWARPGGIVLLSPAAPSFGQFHDYRERSAAFAAAAGRCAPGAGPVAAQSGNGSAS